MQKRVYFIMSKPERQTLLIVESLPPSRAEGLADLLEKVARTGWMDAYTARQRLVGRGPSLFAQGERRELVPMAVLLEDHKLRCWLIDPVTPLFAPARLRSLRITEDAIDFTTGSGPLRLERGMPVVAVLADTSGRAAEKNLKHLMAQRLYQGAGAADALADTALQRAILRAEPVLDLYLLAAEGGIQGAIRILPGGFDPAGLGARATLSGAGNLEQILDLTRSHAGSCTLSLDFGLANLPGCRLKNAEDGPRWQQDNLESLTRYGWLLVALAAGQTVTAAADATGFLAGELAPELTEIVREEATTQTGGSAAPETATQPGSLPPPPTAGREREVRHWLGLVFGATAGLGASLAAGGHQLLGGVITFGMRTGLLPASLAVACLWSGFYFLRLKRRIENTPTSKTRSLAMGLVEVQGRAVRKYALVAPMTQMPCVYYRLRKYRRDRNNRWVLSSASDSGHVPFYLEDDTGRVKVDPRRATVNTRTRQEGHGGQFNMLFGRSGGGDEKWIEDLVPEGTSLYVLGEATEFGLRRPALRTRLVTALQELKRDPDALSRYDTNGDGRICEQEWAYARADLEERLLHASLKAEAASATPEDRVIIRRPRQRSLPFVIAQSSSETHLTRRYGLYCLPLFLTALLAAVWTFMVVGGRTG
ncbi:E3 ubiquitin ligase family protein [Desulfuromonas sp. CSMB_57]|jgi:hypothetical protein|uniref:E3 ubiquitin ligase family protein n=1 Tax=Desulfuromonas sp. CSMB_57 TaxID=2807629 RepID=UPI001CD7601B|nr:E3 ubiquitin ligase family protein [Desulfuromonas sp. CSMB_57]